MAIKSAKWMRILGVTSAASFVAVLLAVHFLHPSADFPNFSPWMDYSKYTDEGWYGSAAVAYFTRGGWYVAGDFNPAVALPLWPFLEWVLFHFTGVSLPAARVLAVAIFGGNVALTYALVRTQAPRWAAWTAAAVLASNAFLYSFSRLAILEPLMIFLFLNALLLAVAISRTDESRRQGKLLAAIGMLLCAMVLTKTTAIFLFPAVGCMLWLTRRGNMRRFLFSSGIVALAAFIPWLMYYLILVRPRYLVDYRYLFTANIYPQPTTAYGWMMAFRQALESATWIDPRLAALSAALLGLSLVFSRGLWRNALFVSCVAAAAGYVFFIGFHNNFQPRYYQVLAFPLVIATMLAIQELFLSQGGWRRVIGAAACSTIGYTVILNTGQTVRFALRPQYTFVEAAQNLTHYIDEHPNRNRLLLSISGSNIALVTGLPAICDDFGTLDLPERIRRYQPGWYAAWNELDPGTLEDLHTQFNLEQVANYPAYDDESRNNLILYKLTPLADIERKDRKPHRPHRSPLGNRAEKPVAIRRVAG